MKHYWRYFLLAALLTACDSSSSTPQKTDPSDPPTEEIPDPPKEEKTCQNMSCPNGCCNDKCVNLQSDPTHCGRCDTVCENYCLNRECVTECSGENARICAGICVDLSRNSENCGACNTQCGPNMECSDKQCVCQKGYSDCDGNALNGCESYVDSCECRTGETAPCYPGDPSTENVGRCKAGYMTCENGIYSFCEDYIEPIPEIPFNGIDDDCDTIVDEMIDEDGDGFYYGAGDCCDNVDQCGAQDPSKVNPNAHEVPGNGIDDDCDDLIDEDDSVLCSTSAKTFDPNSALTANDAVLLAKAMDICDEAAKDGSGLISAEFLQADGSPLPKNGNKEICGNTTLISPAEQVSVATSLGDIVRPLKGTMAVLSSGKAMGKENTGYKDCVGTECKAPKVFLDAHNGFLPVSEICTDASPEAQMANDSMMLRLKLKTPSNAKGFSFRFKFFSKEYPAYVCQNYNDFFLALVDSKHPDIPADHNVSFDAKHNPVSVNNAFFTECDKDACKKEKGCSDCTDGSSNVHAYVADVRQAGATGWLKTSVPVNPGEEFTLDLVIFDAGDRPASKSGGWGHQRDSLVLIDDFTWEYDATTLITVIN